MERSRQELVRGLGAAVQAFQRKTDAFDDAVAEHLGLNRTDLRCLDWLSTEPMSMGRLARETGLSTAATTKLVDRLEEKGFVQRVRSGSDRRSVTVEMTADAAQRIGALFGPLVDDGATFLARYDEAELARLRDYFDWSAELIDRHRRRVLASSADAGDDRGQPLTRT